MPTPGAIPLPLKWAKRITAELERSGVVRKISRADSSLDWLRFAARDNEEMAATPGQTRMFRFVQTE